MGRKKIEWKAGDNFVVPLVDGSYSQGQVIAFEKDALWSALCAFSSVRFQSMPAHMVGVAEPSLIAILFVTPDMLKSGRWQIVGNAPLFAWSKYLDIQPMRNKGFIGTSVYGSGNVAEFLGAYHGLLPWNAYYLPDYLDKMLISPDRKPAKVLLK